MTSELAPRGSEEETEWERLIRKMARLKADINRLDELARDHDDVPGEIAAQLGFIGADYDTLIREFVEYEEGDGEMPDVCPVCDEEIVQVDELASGESYEVEKMCIAEKTTGGPGHGILHFSEGDG